MNLIPFDFRFEQATVRGGFSYHWSFSGLRVFRSFVEASRTEKTTLKTTFGKSRFLNFISTPVCLEFSESRQLDLQNLSSRPAFGKLTNECVEGEVKDGLLFTPAIKARIAEFLGTAPASGSATCIFLITGNEHQLNHLKARKVSELPACLEQDFEICRSLWDSASLLVDLDIEYVNFDFSAEPYLHPHRAFALQEVVETTVEKQLLNFGIEPLHLLSGRGHHFIWRIRRDSRSFDQLKTLGHERTASPGGAEIDLALGAAYHGLGQAIEYLAAEVKRLSAGFSKIPVELTAVEVGPGERGREMISLDISEFGDPLDSRSARVPYSRYLKPQQQKTSLGEQFIDNLPPIFEIPQHEMSVTKALRVMRDPEAVAELAQRAAGFVPDCSAGMETLISSYTASALAKFHRDFYSTEPDPPESWPNV